LAALQAQVANHPLRGAVAFVFCATPGAMFAFVSSALLVPAAIHALDEDTTFLLLWRHGLPGTWRATASGACADRDITAAIKNRGRTNAADASGPDVNAGLTQIKAPGIRS
jgi:hypothetical protein